MEVNAAVCDYISLYQGDQATLMESPEVIEKTWPNFYGSLRPFGNLWRPAQPKTKQIPNTSMLPDAGSGVIIEI